MVLNSNQPNTNKTTAEIQKQEVSRSLFDLFIFIVRGLVFMASAVVAFNFLFTLLLKLFSGSYAELFINHIEPHFNPAKWDPIFAIFVAIIIVDSAMDVFLLKKKPSPTFFAPYIPFVFFAIVSEENSIIYSALAISIAFFLLRKVHDFGPLTQIPENGLLSGDSLVFKILIVIGSVTVLVILDHFLVGKNRAGMFLILFFLIGITFFCTRWDYRATIKVEAVLLFLAFISGQALQRIGLMFGFNIWFSPLLFIFLFTLFYLVVFFHNRKTLRWINIAMPVLLIFTFSTMENYLQTYNIGEKKRPIPKLAIQPKHKKGIIGNVLPFGDLNPFAAGWSFEIGHFRMGIPAKDKKSNTYRIIVQGSSSTEGINIKKDEDVWSSVLEKSLNLTGFPYEFEVINAGIGGTTSFGMLMNFSNELLELKPDMLILYICHNDQSYKRGPFTEKEMFAMATDDDLVKSFPNPLSNAKISEPKKYSTKWIVKIQMFLSRFASYRLLRRKILDLSSVDRALYGFALSRVLAVPPEDFRANLERFATLCKRENIQLVFIGEACLCNLEQYKEIMKNIASEQKVSYFDANQKLSECNLPETDLFFDTVHLTIKGNACIASVIKNHLLGNSILPGSENE